MKKISYVVVNGNSKIILSAPHSVNHTREGITRVRETKTGVLVKEISKKSGVFGIYKTKDENNDANWDKNCEYKEAIVKLIKQNKIKTLLDLHGMAAWRKEDICIGTNMGKNINGDTELLECMVKIFNKYGFKNVTIDVPFAAKHPYCVSTYIASKCKIPTYQIEINLKYRTKFYKEYEKYPKLEMALQEIIEKIKERVKE